MTKPWTKPPNTQAVQFFTGASKRSPCGDHLLVLMEKEKLPINAGGLLFVLSLK